MWHAVYYGVPVLQLMQLHIVSNELKKHGNIYSLFSRNKIYKEVEEENKSN